MATIALYASKANKMSSLITDLGRSVRWFRDDIDDLSFSAAAVDSGVCDLTEVINSLRSSSDTQEAKAEALSDAAEKTEQFLEDVVDIDENAAEAINRSKNDFYDTYEYLRPDIEKSGWEKFWTGAKEWCKEHWKALATIGLVIAAVLVIVFTGGTAIGPIAALLITLSKGVLIGTLVGGVMGGIAGGLSPNSTFLQGLEGGAFGGALGGLLTAGIGSAVAGATGLASIADLSLLQNMLIGGTGDAFTSILTNLGDHFFKGDDISAGQYIFDALFSFGTGVLFTKLGDSLGNLIPPLKINGINKGRGSWKFDWMYDLANVGRNGRIMSRLSILKGLGAEFVDGVLDHGIEFFKSLTGEGWDAYKSWVSA